VPDLLGQAVEAVELVEDPAIVGELARSHFVDVGDVELSDLHGRQCNDGVSRARDASLRHPAAYRSADRRPTDRSGMMRR
jgi:hypothetical protein